jgi:hypothetical protein
MDHTFLLPQHPNQELIKPKLDPAIEEDLNLAREDLWLLKLIREKHCSYFLNLLFCYLLSIITSIAI